MQIFEDSKLQDSISEALFASIPFHSSHIPVHKESHLLRIGTPTNFGDYAKSLVSREQIEMVMANPEILSGFVGNMPFTNNPASTADQQEPENEAE